MVGKKHGSREIADKMAQADQLAAKGKTQREISKALGVSIMTYHRWRKMLKSSESSGNGAQSEVHIDASTPLGGSAEDTIKRLKFENAQLRRLVTDALLEKLNYEDQLRAYQKPRFRRSEKG